MAKHSSRWGNIVLLACGLLSMSALAQTPSQVLQGLSKADQERLLQQYGGHGTAATASVKAGPQVTPPRKPPQQMGGIAGFEGRGDLRPFGSRLMESAGDYTTVLDIPVPGDYDIGPRRRHRTPALR